MAREQYYNPFDPKSELELWVGWNYVNSNISPIITIEPFILTIDSLTVLARFPLFNGLYLIKQLIAIKKSDNAVGIVRMTDVDNVSFDLRSTLSAYDSLANTLFYENQSYLYNFLIKDITLVSSIDEISTVGYKLLF